MSELIIGAAGAGATLLGTIIGYGTFMQAQKKAIRDEGSGDGELKADISYIKRGVEDIRIDMKATEKTIGDLSERVTRVEESSKQAHKRIDDQQKRKKVKLIYNRR